MNDFTEPFLPPEPAKVTAGGVILSVDLIDADRRVREVNEAAVAQMADSIERQGLISPILVRPMPDGRYRLVLGGHRLAAIRLLGRDQVRCEIRDLDDDEALGLELEENLCRHELDQLDFAIFCMEREALDERMKLRPKPGGDRQSAAGKASRQVGGMLPRFTDELAEKVGRSERTVQRAIQIAKALDPEAVALLRGTKHADNQQALLTLSRERNPAKQRNLAQALRDGAKTVHGARIAVGDETPAVDNPQERYFGTLLHTWMLADGITKKRFLDAIDAAPLTVQPAKGGITTSKAEAIAAATRQGRRL